MIGKDFILQDIRDPLGTLDQKSLSEKYKLYQESLCDHDALILSFAQRAIQHYKTKARQAKGSSQSMYKRMIQFISFHISEIVLAHLPNTEHKTQKYRGQIARSLI